MKKAENYSSPLLKELLSKLDPEEQERTDKKMGLAAKIADTIKMRGLSKKQFAQKMNKVPSEISKWLSGDQILHLKLF